MVRFRYCSFPIRVLLSVLLLLRVLPSQFFSTASLLYCFTSSAQLKIDGCFAHLFSISPTVPHRLFKSKFEGSHLLLIGKEKWRWVPSILDYSKRNTKEASGDGVFRWCWSEEGGKVAFVDVLDAGLIVILQETQFSGVHSLKRVQKVSTGAFGSVDEQHDRRWSIGFGIDSFALCIITGNDRGLLQDRLEYRTMRWWNIIYIREISSCFSVNGLLKSARTTIESAVLFINMALMLISMYLQLLGLLGTPPAFNLAVR
uniref:Uncharacterized protein n=1 Tax=Lactuca sativa TaxID=4236 RepID=A0A9R1VQT2_LACSA|nr:hypothetical protein LSAT_V11C400180220 [Lactuca sativa]